MILRRLIILLATFSALSAPVHADGRSDWDGYAWQKIAASDCIKADDGRACPLYHERWDWKRNQWVSILVVLGKDAVRLTQRLEDNDWYDDDDVCVTAVVVDAEGRNLAVHHTNWYMTNGQTREEVFEYPAARLDSAATIHIGSKQCRKGPHEDDEVFAEVTQRLAR